MDNLFNREHSTESITNTVSSTTNTVALAFPLDFRSRCLPFPIDVFKYVDVRDFNSEVRKDIVLNDIKLSKKDDLNHADWIGVAWTIGRLSRLAQQNRKIQGANYRFASKRSGNIQKQIFAESQIEISLTLFISSIEWAIALQEILSTNHIDGGFDFTFNEQVYRASYIPDMTMTEVVHVDRNKYGNLVSFSLGLKLNYPIVLDIKGGSLVKRIDVTTIAINHKQMNELTKDGKKPDVSDDAIVGHDKIVGISN